MVGNPPFLSQMAAATSRRGASRHGGGPYADAAVEFLSLAHALVTTDGGRFGLVLPQSILAARDGGDVRDRITATSNRIWSWWSPDRLFDAQVRVCAVAFQRVADRAAATPDEIVGSGSGWTSVITDAIGVPAIDECSLHVSGTIGDRAHLNANFRDEYYGMVPAVVDRGKGPPLITSGLIDPGRCWWSERPMRFAKRRLDAPTVELDRLDPKMQAWAARKLVPKVLVANQTRVIEAVADAEGIWLPGVPVTAITPTTEEHDVWDIAAVLTSPVASALAWHELAGTGLSATSIRLGPKVLGSLAWPAGALADAVAALAAGDILACGSAVTTAYGITGTQAEALMSWWADALPTER